MAEIRLIHLTEGAECAPFLFLNQLPQKRQEQVLRFRSRKDQYRSYIGGLLMQEMCRTRLGRRQEPWDFQYNAHGKPYLAQYPQIQFNISHSGDYVAGVIDSAPCGIDIEQIEEEKHWSQIARHFFSKKEQEALFGKEAAKQMAYFYYLWTMKEAVSKKEGTGLSKSLDAIDLDIQKGFCLSKEIEEGYWMSVLTETKAVMIQTEDQEFLKKWSDMR